MTETVSRLREALADRYRIERELGAGGMATVYLAQDLKHDRKVAIKVLKPELSAVIGAERFLREIKTIATLQHPHILGLIDSGEVNGTAYYVMPFVEGESLRDRLRREKQLPINDAVRIATEVASALDYAHRHGVIHRDIKPENVMLHDGSALVADFGIALAVSSAGGSSRMTETGMSLGTPHYMSPEQAMGEREITARSDVYALGAMTYEMLIGDPPFTGSTAQAIVAKVMTEKPAPLRRQRERVPDTVEDAVLTALEKLPADRFAGAKDFADALAGSGTVRMTSPRLRTRRRLASTLGAFAAGALLAGLGAWALRPAAKAEQVVRFALALPPNLSPLPRTASGTTLAISPDGKLVVFVGDGDGIQRLYARPIDEAMPRVLPGTEGATQPFFSPDGRWIGFWADGKLQRLPLDGRAPQPICDIPEPFGATWADGDHIIMGSAAGLLVVPAGGGTPEPLTPADSTGRPRVETFPVALTGSDRVLYGSWGQGGLEGIRIAIVSLGSRRKTVLDLPGIAPIGVAAGQLLFSRVDRSLWAAPFDAASARLSGSPVVVGSNMLFVGSRGGTKVALSASGSLVYLDANARESQLVLAGQRVAPTPLEGPVRAYGFPRYSPDGSRIAVTIATDPRSDVWLLDLAAGTPVRLSTIGTVNERAEWTPDGQQVLFRSDAGGKSAIWWRPTDLSGPAVKLLGGPPGIYFEAGVAPDGQSLVYQIDTAGGDVEYRRLTGDTTPKPIAVSRYDENMPRLSPDGRWIAFVTNESGATQVVVQPFPGPGGRVQVSVNDGTEPVWSRDGRRLFYRGEGKFMAASIVTSPRFAVTGRTALFDDTYLRSAAPHANYDVSPDGSRLLVLRPTNNTAQIVLVHGWSQELRTRLGGAPR
jgi:eukaryotic-like serine/threonine-protein kinase